MLDLESCTCSKKIGVQTIHCDQNLRFTALKLQEEQNIRLGFSRRLLDSMASVALVFP